jgi:arylsulfatase A-like enzyme
MKYPGRIEPGTVSERAFCSIDILPTLAHLTGAALPDNAIDGKNAWDLILGKPGATNAQEYYPFSTGRTFEGIISGDGRWKLHLPHNYRTLVEPGHDGQPGKYQQAEIGLTLFDMKNDPYETTDVIEKHPGIAQRLKNLAEQHKQRFYTK